MGFSRQGTWPRWLPLAVVAAVLLVQAPLVFNPGYFAHDELQWAAYAGQHPGWYFRDYLWTGLQSFQYRPLTFSLWLLLSQQLFAHPYAFHGLMVAWGALNAAMLAVLLRRFAVAPAAALSGALVFALSPFAMQTHGWVGTIGDLVWMGCALATGPAGAARTVALGDRRRCRRADRDRAAVEGVGDRDPGPDRARLAAVGPAPRLGLCHGRRAGAGDRLPDAAAGRDPVLAARGRQLRLEPGLHSAALARVPAVPADRHAPGHQQSVAKRLFRATAVDRGRDLAGAGMRRSGVPACAGCWRSCCSARRRWGQC